MNQLSNAERVQIISALVEGNSINSTCRMTGRSKHTVLKLLEQMGDACLKWHNLHVVNLSTRNVQMDEIWGFVHSKDKNVQSKNWGKGHGDCWTWVALDAEAKLIINWAVGGRDGGTGYPFVADTARRLADRIQLTSDGWGVYREAVKRAFGDDVDYAQLIKEYGTERAGHARYSPPTILACHTNIEIGNPERENINTSFVERQNLTMRMGMRRFTRLTNGFSKKIENHKHAVALHFMHYNFCRIHKTLRVTPAMEAGIADHVWEIEELVRLLD